MPNKKPPKKQKRWTARPKAKSAIVELERFLIRKFQAGLRANYKKKQAKRVQGIAFGLLLEQWKALIWSYVRKYGRPGVADDDLYQAGCMGFLRSIEKFELDRGLRLSTYASWWIRQSVQREVDQTQSTIHIPDARLRKGWIDDEPLPTISEHDLDELGDFLHDGSSVEKSAHLHDAIERLNGMMDRLNARLRSVLTARASGQTLKEIGIKYRISRERVRQLERNALNELRVMAGLPKRYDCKPFQTHKPPPRKKPKNVRRKRRTKVSPRKPKYATAGAPAA
jgi:RNA polymerase sigma factor (sigma-70 family)